MLRSPDISAFNADILLRRLNIAADDWAARQSIYYLYKTMREDPANPTDLVEKTRRTIENVMEHVEFPHHTLRKYLDNFVPEGIHIDRNALTMAVLCDAYLLEGNEPLQHSEDQDEEDILNNRRQDGLNPETLANAKAYWEEAQDLETFGALLDTDNVSTIEGSFIAHLDFLQYFSQIQETINEYETHDDPYEFEGENVEVIMARSIPKMRSVIRLHTNIGREVQHAADQIFASLAARVAPMPTTLPPRGSHLTLIRS